MAALLKMTGIQKSFNNTPVLKNVDFEVDKGEIHAVMGENGAGKSTLIKILTGIYPKDGGQIWFDGQNVEINDRQDAEKLGIGVVYQELSLIPTLNVVQNIMLGREKTKGLFVNYQAMKKEVAELIRKYQFDIDPEAVVETLPIAQRQIVEILKALSGNSKLIIMDEPTASLSTKESETLFGIIRNLRAQNVSIIYISHRLEEVYQLSDRLTILRDGERIGVIDHDDLVPEEAVKMMIGKDLGEAKRSGQLRVSDKPVRLEVKDLCRAGAFRNVSFQLHEGEILGLTGLMNAGRTEVVRAIYGADHFDSGQVFFEGQEIRPDITSNILRGFGFVPEDRKTQGFVPLLSVTKNVALTNYDVLARGGFVDPPKEKALGEKMVESLRIRPGDPGISVGNLSGGNQQKAVLSKSLSRDLKILIIDEPTAGIDIGAKEEIYQILEELAENGTSVLMVSSDLQEVVRVSQRIIVMRKGEFFKEFNSGTVTQEEILMAESGILMKEDAEDDKA